MKKVAFSLIASLALIQSAHAAVSPLAESLREYDAIVSALGSDPYFSLVIPPIEFITDIKRLTKKTNVLGEVKYKIIAKGPSDPGQGCDNHTHDGQVYIATLLITPNPGIGPNIIIVLNVEPAHRH